MLRKLLVVVFIGFVVVMLAGPVLGILAVMMLPALVGFLLWATIYRLCAGRMPSLADVRAWWRRTHQRLCQTARSILSTDGHKVLERVRDTLRVTIIVIGETLSGAVVGGFVVHLSQREHSFPPVAEATGALGGALIGLLLALSHWRSYQKRSLRQLPEGAE